MQYVKTTLWVNVGCNSCVLLSVCSSRVSFLSGFHDQISENLEPIWWALTGRMVSYPRELLGCVPHECSVTDEILLIHVILITWQDSMVFETPLFSLTWWMLMSWAIFFSIIWHTYHQLKMGGGNSSLPEEYGHSLVSLSSSQILLSSLTLCTKTVLLDGILLHIWIHHWTMPLKTVQLDLQNFDKSRNNSGKLCKYPTPPPHAYMGLPHSVSYFKQHSKLVMENFSWLHYCIWILH